MIRNAPPKDPASTKWYWFTWSEKELQGATINTATWAPVAGINIDNSLIDGFATGVLLSGGAEGDNHELPLQITTSSGEVLNETVRIKIRSTGH